jgi:hypothetical protein
MHSRTGIFCQDPFPTLTLYVQMNILIALLIDPVGNHAKLAQVAWHNYSAPREKWWLASCNPRASIDKQDEKEGSNDPWTILTSDNFN